MVKSSLRNENAYFMKTRSTAPPLSPPQKKKKNQVYGVYGSQPVGPPFPVSLAFFFFFPGGACARSQQLLDQFCSNFTDGLNM